MRRRFRPSLGRLQPKTNTKDNTGSNDGSSGNESTTSTTNQPTRRARIKPKVGIVRINRNIEQQPAKPAVKRPTIQPPLDKQTTKSNDKTENEITEKDISSSLSQLKNSMLLSSSPSNTIKPSDAVDKSQSNQHNIANPIGEKDGSPPCEQNIQKIARNSTGITRNDKPQKTVVNKEARLKIKLINSVDNTGSTDQNVNTPQSLKGLSSCPEPQLLNKDSFPCMPVLIDNSDMTNQTQVPTGINLSEFDKIHNFNDLIQHLLEDTNVQSTPQNNETLLHTDVACLSEANTQQQQPTAVDNSTSLLSNTSPNTVKHKDNSTGVDKAPKLNTKRRYKPRKPKQVKGVYNNISTLLQYDISEIPIASNVIICDDNTDKQCEEIDHPILELPVDLIENDEVTSSTPKQTRTTKSMKQRFKQKQSGTVKLVVSRKGQEADKDGGKNKTKTVNQKTKAKSSQGRRLKETVSKEKATGKSVEMQEESSNEDSLNTTQCSINTDISLPSTIETEHGSDVAADTTTETPSDNTTTENTTNIVNEDTTSLNASHVTGNESQLKDVETHNDKNEKQVGLRRKRARVPNLNVNRKQMSVSNNNDKTVQSNSASKEVEQSSVVASSDSTNTNELTTTLLTSNDNQVIDKIVSTVNSASLDQTIEKDDTNIVNSPGATDSERTNEQHTTIATSNIDEPHSDSVQHNKTSKSVVNPTSVSSEATIQRGFTGVSGQNVKKRMAGMPNINITRKTKTPSETSTEAKSTTSECGDSGNIPVPTERVPSIVHQDDDPNHQNATENISNNDTLITARRRRVSKPNLIQNKRRKPDENSAMAQDDTPCLTRGLDDHTRTVINHDNEHDESTINELSTTQSLPNNADTDPNTSHEIHPLPRKRKIGPNLSNIRQRSLNKADDTNITSHNMDEPLHGTNVPLNNLDVTTSAVVDSSTEVNSLTGSSDLQDISLNITENINDELPRPLLSVVTTRSLEEGVDENACVRVEDTLESGKVDEGKKERKKRGRPKGKKSTKASKDITQDGGEEEASQTTGVKRKDKNSMVPGRKMRKKGKDNTEDQEESNTIDDTNDNTVDNPEEHGETIARKKRTTKNTSSNKATSDNEHTKSKGRKAHRGTKDLDKMHIPEMRISDLAYYNPRTNPMKETGNDGSFLNNSSAQEEVRPLETQTNDTTPTTTATTTNDGDSTQPPSEVLAPQVTIDADGNIVLDEESLMIRAVTPSENQENREVVFENKNQQFRSGRKRYNMSRWKKEETLYFYDVLSQVGTDFSLMAKLFENRDRGELKKKFKREEKYNRDLVEKALSQRNPISAELFKDCLEETETEIEQSFEVNSDENVKENVE